MDKKSLINDCIAKLENILLEKRHKKKKKKSKKNKGFLRVPSAGIYYADLDVDGSSDGGDGGGE